MGGDKSDEYGGWLNVATFFLSENVELFLSYGPGHCHAGRENYECGTGRDKLIKCAKLGGVTHLYNILH